MWSMKFCKTNYKNFLMNVAKPVTWNSWKTTILFILSDSFYYTHNLVSILTDKLTELTENEIVCLKIHICFHN
jgi:hypothetical protein